VAFRAATLAAMLGAAAPAAAGETPKYGGSLIFMIPPDAPPPNRYRLRDNIADLGLPMARPNARQQHNALRYAGSPPGIARAERDSGVCRLGRSSRCGTGEGAGSVAPDDQAVASRGILGERRPMTLSRSVWAQPGS
jgi:hypothetical protein